MFGEATTAALTDALWKARARAPERRVARSAAHDPCAAALTPHHHRCQLKRARRCPPPPRPPPQTRLEAMEGVVAKAAEAGAGGIAPSLVQALAVVPGWDEKNFQAGRGEAFGACSARKATTAKAPPPSQRSTGQRGSCMTMRAPAPTPLAGVGARV